MIKHMLMCRSSFTKSTLRGVLHTGLAVSVLLGVTVSPLFAAEDHKAAEHLAHKTTRLSADARIAKQSAEALLRDQAVNLLDVSVTVSHGIVSLDGTVDSFYQKTRAEELIERVEGVIAVTNNLKVAPHRFS